MSERDDRNGHDPGTGIPPAPGQGGTGLPRTERPGAPAYLKTYLERRAKAVEPDADDDATAGEEDPTVPLYLRRFRARTGSEVQAPLARPIPGDVAPTWTEAWAKTSRSNEVVLPPEFEPPADGARGVVDVHLVRHAETQGYSVNGGLSPMGRWQAHRRGHDLSKAIRDGRPVRVITAPTARASQTAEQIRRGVEDGLVLWARHAPVSGPDPMDEFRNFTVWTPSGERDATAAFREYHAVAERYERVAMGDRPLWLVEMDRFFRIQMGGGDPIHFWMTVPLLDFEPPAAVVLRFWAGISRLVAGAEEGERIIVATHSGPMRAFATWALGHDAGEPYNVEEVRVKVRRSLTEAQVTYRNRTSEVHIPPAAEEPSWWQHRPAAATAGVAG